MCRSGWLSDKEVRFERSSPLLEAKSGNEQNLTAENSKESTESSRLPGQRPGGISLCVYMVYGHPAAGWAAWAGSA